MSEESMDEENIHETLTLQNEDEEEDEESEDEEPKFCGVCGDQAKGYHFNALTCEGCKGFFRRTIKRSDQLRCPFLNRCAITRKNRRSCQACRFRKCKAIGMRQEMVMSDEKVQERRSRIKKNKMRSSPMQLSSHQQEMIEEMLSGHRSTFDPTFSRFSGFRPMDRNISCVSEYNQSAPEACNPPSICPDNTCTAASDPTTSSCDRSFSSSSSSSSLSHSHQKREGETDKKVSVFTALPHVTDLTTHMIQDIINFSKSLRFFRSLPIKDQIALLKGASFEIMQIRFNMVFNANTSMWECGHFTYCVDDAVRAGFQSVLVDPLFKLHHTLRKLDLQEEEYVLIQAISLFSPDRPGVQQHGIIDDLHENLGLTLKTWIDCKRTGPEKHLLYPRVMACLTEMRTMTEEYSKQVLHIQDIQPDDISPLIMEVVSKDI